MREMFIHKIIIKRNQDKWKNSPSSSIRRLSIIQKSILPIFTRFNIIPIEIQTVMFRGENWKQFDKLMLKFTWKCQKPRVTQI